MEHNNLASARRKGLDMGMSKATASLQSIKGLIGDNALSYRALSQFSPSVTVQLLLRK